jgi:metallo-beta-lactamase class B
MKIGFAFVLSAMGVGIALGSVSTMGQARTAESHIAAAKTAAGPEWDWMHNRLCNQALGDMAKSAPGAAAPAPARAGGPPPPPPQEKWYAPPVKVFDNLYRVGTIEHSAWALNTSDGIILFDAIYDYTVREATVEGMKKVGLDPSKVKYAIIGHAHGDHVGGASYLQELYQTKIVLSADDWDLLYRTGPTAASAVNMPKPTKDVVATDGMKITVGDTTVTVYVTPGHTKGTLSSIFQVKDRGKTHTVAYWGGTMYNWVGGSLQYITPATPKKYWFDIYANSAERFRDIAAKAGADVVLSNHTEFDGTKAKEPLLAKRGPNDPHPFVGGPDSVRRFLTVVAECARAGSLRAN